MSALLCWFPTMAWHSAQSSSASCSAGSRPLYPLLGLPLGSWLLASCSLHAVAAAFVADSSQYDADTRPTMCMLSFLTCLAPTPAPTLHFSSQSIVLNSIASSVAAATLFVNSLVWAARSHVSSTHTSVRAALCGAVL